MNSNKCLHIFYVKLCSYKNSYFSSLPYSAYKTNLLLNTNPTKTQIRLNKFRWRNNVVSLRAPKHFKVGRQHYNKSSRIVLHNLENHQNNWTKNLNTMSTISNFIKLTPLLYNRTQQPPLSITKTSWITLGFKFQFKSIK